MNVNIKSNKAISSEMHLNIIINDRIFTQFLSCAHLCVFYMPKCAYTPKLMHIYTLCMFICTVKIPEYSIAIRILTITYSNFITLDTEEIYSAVLQ